MEPCALAYELLDGRCLGRIPWTWLDFPEDLPAGNYELRLVVYNFETLVPTVEIGVWEAETTLARLRLAETQ